VSERPASSGRLVRRASAGERDGVVGTVTAAFREDPAWRYLLGMRYARLATELAGALFDVRVGRGNVWVSEGLQSVAMWSDSPHGDGADARAEQVWEHYRTVAGERSFARLLAYNEAVAAASGGGEYLYLGTLATRPERRREGLACAVLRPVLEHADQAGLACCLETSTAANRRFYEGRGFTEATDVELARGPQTWWLRRPPAPPGVRGASAQTG
jgi:ribosomal protein S18 acetylase RimI-like enzyme